MTFAALSHPSLQDCRRMFLRNYEVQINIGVHEFEKKGEQRVLVNIDLFVSLAETTPQADKLEEVVDYDFMRNTVAARMAQGTSICRKRCATMWRAPCCSTRRCARCASRPRSPTSIPTANRLASRSSI